MDRHDSGYGAEMDPPAEDTWQGPGQKAMLITLPEDDLDCIQVALKPEEVSNSNKDTLTSSRGSVTLHDIQRDSLLSSNPHSFQCTITDDSDVVRPDLTVIHSNNSPDGKEVSSPNEFVFWEEPHNSPAPKKALLRATLSLPVSPVYKSSNASKDDQTVFHFTTEDVAAITKQTTDQGTSPFLLLPQTRNIGDNKPRPHSSYANLMPSSNTLQSFFGATFEGPLWLVDLSEGRKKSCWFVLHKERLLMFETNMPEAEMLESWDLAECKIANVPQKVEFALVTKFAAQHSFQITRNESKSITVLSSEIDSVCTAWIQKLTSASNNAWKAKGSKLFQTFSLKAHFTKSPNSLRQKSKALLAKRPQISKASFAETYGWAEQQSHKRVHRTTPIQTKVGRSQKEKQIPTELHPLVRANSDSQLSSHQEKEDILDRSNSTEPQIAKHERDDKMFGSLRKTLAGLPQLGKTPPVVKHQRPALAISYSTPLEPSAKAGILLVKRHTSWNRCWVKLHGSSLHFYKDGDEALPFEVISLSGYSVHHTAGVNSPVGQIRFKFILQSEEKGTIQFLADTELDGRLWAKRFQEACNSGNMSSILKKSPVDDIDGYDHNSNETIQSDASDSLSESPMLQQKRIMIQKKFQQANETEDINSLKRSLILNQRRMSAQTKLHALDKQVLEQKALRAKNKKGRSKCEPALADEFDASTKELIDELHQKVESIDKGLNDNILKTDQRRQALRRKQEMELEILHQERELMKYRSRAQAALKTMMLQSVIPSPLSEVKESEGDTSDSVSNLPVANTASRNYCIDNNLQGKTNSMSSSMSSLSSSSTNESYGSSHSYSKGSPKLEQLSSRSTDSVFSNNQMSGTPDSGIHQPISKKYSPVSSPDMIPEQDSLNTSDSDSVDGILILPLNVKPKLRTEVPPEVLRDINEFEEMAKLALRKAGWLPADIF